MYPLCNLFIYVYLRLICDHFYLYAVNRAEPPWQLGCIIAGHKFTLYMSVAWDLTVDCFCESMELCLSFELNANILNAIYSQSYPWTHFGIIFHDFGPYYLQIMLIFWIYRSSAFTQGVVH